MLTFEPGEVRKLMIPMAGSEKLDFELIDKLAKEKQEASSGSGPFGNGSAMGYDGGGGAVSLELGGEQIDVPAAELVEMTQGANVDIQA